jgi:hypothetical protein
MQTFLPYPSFRESARCLDYRRLGKQRVECKQLLLAIGVPVGDHRPKRSSWVSHPAARMWRRFPLALAEYAMVVCREWRVRGYRDTLLPQFEAAWEWCAWGGINGASPNWIGYDAFHASHRSNLLRKNREWYGQFGWLEPADLEYVWPVGKEESAA